MLDFSNVTGERDKPLPHERIDPDEYHELPTEPGDDGFGKVWR